MLASFTILVLLLVYSQIQFLKLLATPKLSGITTPGTHAYVHLEVFPTDSCHELHSQICSWLEASSVTPCHKIVFYLYKKPQGINCTDGT